MAEIFLRQINVAQTSAAEHAKELHVAIKNATTFAEFCAALRQHKQREYLRIGARDLMPSVTLEETVRELSALAEASLDAAYHFCRAEVEKDYGPLNLPGTEKPNRFVILGLGKLGGSELNFSSDVDVIFLYDRLCKNSDCVQGMVSKFCLNRAKHDCDFSFWSFRYLIVD